MDPVSDVASVIAVVQLTGAIVKICAKYLSNVKNAREDIERFQARITALSSVLRSLADMMQNSHSNKLAATQELTSNIAKCSVTLTKLKRNIDPESTQKPMRKWGLRSFKWPLSRSQVDDAVKEIEAYETTFTLCLQVDQMYVILEKANYCLHQANLAPL